MQKDECGEARRKQVGVASFFLPKVLRCARARFRRCGPQATRLCSAYGVYDEHKHPESACCTSTCLPLGITSGLSLGEYRRDQKQPGLAACTFAMPSFTLNYCIALMHSYRSQDLSGTVRSSRTAASNKSKDFPDRAAGPISGDAAVIGSRAQAHVQLLACL